MWWLSLRQKQPSSVGDDKVLRPELDLLVLIYVFSFYTFKEEQAPGSTLGQVLEHRCVLEIFGKYLELFV